MTNDIRRKSSPAGPAVYHWNPRPILFGGRLSNYARSPRRTNNFGDMLGPLIVTRLLTRAGVETRISLSHGPRDPRQRVLGVGSIVHKARDGDIVWGSGVNGNAVADAYQFASLDVRAVRGPLTRDFLLARGIPVPEVFGDPGVLVPDLFPEWRADLGARRHPITVVPNLFDFDRLDSVDADVVLDPRRPVGECVRRIAASDLVVGSSLHGIIVAEAFGIPAVPMVSFHEHRFKYEDYYAGTGRDLPRLAASISEAERAVPAGPAAVDRRALIAAFPTDAWL